jgi:hypothetical protein
MTSYFLYRTADDKIIFLGAIYFIGAVEESENNSRAYKIFQHDERYIVVAHPDEDVLKKDRRKLESAWAKYLSYQNRK